MNLGKKLWERRGLLLLAFGAGLLLVSLRSVGWLQPFEWMALDKFFRMRPKESIDPRIVIVRIDESDLEKLVQWPFSDAVLAKLLVKIRAQHPRAIGLDLYRNLPVSPGTEELKRVFESTPNLIGIQKKIGDNNSKAIPPSAVLKKLDRVGFNDVVIDSDRKLRRGLLFITEKNGETSMSLGMSLAMIYLQGSGVVPDPKSTNLRLGKAEFVPFEASDGGYANADAAGYQTIINFRKSAFRTVSMSSVLEGDIPPDMMRDRIVLIGAYASSLKDFFYAPYGSTLISPPAQTPGVEIQANIISQILSAALSGRPLIKVWPDWLETVWIFLWSGIGARYTWKWRSLPVTSFFLLLAGGGLVGGAYAAFLFGGWWIPVMPPLMAMGGSAFLVTNYISQQERKERQTVMTLFGRYVSPKVAEAIWHQREQILSQGRVKGQKVTATVLFTDIQGFTTIAEKLDPDILMSWLNEYMGEMVQLVLAYGGIVNKFIGDSIMAVFGVLPVCNDEETIALQAIASVLCARSMAASLNTLNDQWSIRGLPTIAMRVGIATGSVVVGSIGSKQRGEYTVMGDTVNVASRLESYDKSIDGGVCRILVNEATYHFARDLLPMKFLGDVVLKGRSNPINIYQLLGD